MYLLYVHIRWYDGTEVEYMDFGDKYSNWFTRHLGQAAHLGYCHPDLVPRNINPNESVRQGPGHKTSSVTITDQIAEINANFAACLGVVNSLITRYRNAL